MKGYQPNKKLDSKPPQGGSGVPKMKKCCKNCIEWAGFTLVCAMLAM